MARKKKIPIVNQNWLLACFERWYKVDKNDFAFIPPEYPKPIPENPKHKKMSSGIAFSEMETFNKTTLSSMNDEVDEALSEEDTDNEESSNNIQNQNSSKETTPNSSYNSNNEASDFTSDDEMAADIEKQLNSNE